MVSVKMVGDLELCGIKLVHSFSSFLLRILMEKEVSLCFCLKVILNPEGLDSMCQDISAAINK